MPKLIVKANQSDRVARSVTSARVLATHLNDDHDATPLLERRTWAAVDAERLESPKNGEQADEHPRSATSPTAGRHGLKPPADAPIRLRASGADMTTRRPIATRPPLDRRPSLSEPDAPEPAGDERDHELAAARWLYEWSYDALRPTGELLAARLTSPPSFDQVGKQPGSRPDAGRSRLSRPNSRW